MKRTLCLFLALILAVGICFSAPVTITASAADSVSYVDYTWDEESKTLSSETKSVDTYTEITSTTTEMTSGWYVVNGEVTVAERMTATGEVHLILADGAHLTASEGITVNEGNSLYIYGQSSDESTMGKLTATTTTTDYDAAIGSLKANHAGNIVINGGNINASASASGDGAAIGSAGSRGGYQITINAGVVTATSGNSSAAIGSGNSGGDGAVWGTVHSICINGGVVNATVTANGGAAIGGGSSFDGGDITITGGTVTATNEGAGAAIGGGMYGSGGNITITGGNVTATYTDSVYYGVAIGAGYYGESAGNILITGGTVTATSTRGCGIGVFPGDNGRIVILGGTVNASGSGTVHINAGASGSMMLVDGTTVTLSGDFTLQTDFVLSEGYTLEISEGATLTIPEGVTLTLPEEYTLISNGTVNAVGTVNCITHKYIKGVCICGFECNHVGGTPTCTAPAVCTICGTGYGEVDSTNHNWENGVCTYGCNTIHEPHDWSGKDSICTVCGATCTHTGGEATCTEKAVCTICGASYGDFAPHTYENGKCTVANCENACAHETITDGVCVTCGGKHCGNTENDKVVWFCDATEYAPGDETLSILTITGKGDLAGYTIGEAPWETHRESIVGIDIKDGVTSIGNGTFCGCVSLTAVIIPGSVKTIGGGAFTGCESLSNVRISEGVTSIGNYAFENCTRLKEITIPKSVETIGEHAFNSCTMLMTITIPQNVTVIGEGAFCNCTRLTEINVDEGNTTYSSEDGVLFNEGKTELICCPAGKAGDYEVPSYVTSISNYAFSSRGDFFAVTIPVSVTTIGDYAFEGSQNVNLIVEPGSETHKFAKTNSIPYIFNGCITKEETDQIEKLLFTLNADSESYSVTFCDAHISGALNIPATYNGKPVTEIGNYAFENCTSLASVTIPDTITTIGAVAFCKCSSLSSITIPKNVTTIGDYAFLGCAELSSITVDDNNNYYSNSEDGVLFDKNKENLICYPAGKTETGYTVPKSVITIGEGAFMDCIALTSVTIGEDVEIIGIEAFYGCTALETVTILNSETVIKTNVFYECNALTTVNAPCDWDENKYAFDEGVLKIAEHVTTSPATCISKAKCSGCGEYGDFADHTYKNGKCTFANCNNACAHETITDGVCVTCGGKYCGADKTKDKVVWFYEEATTTLTITGKGAMADYDSSDMPWNDYKSRITDIVIGNGVTAIGTYAFTGYENLEFVILPDGLKAIGDNAFKGCSSLSSLAIPHTVTTIGSSAFYNCAYITLIVEIGSRAHSYAKENYIRYLLDDYDETEIADVEKIFFDEISNDNNDNSEVIAYAVTGCDEKISGDIRIPASYNGKPVTEIDADAFATCTELTSVIIPKSVTTIGENAFANCDTLNSVEIFGNVTIIGAHTFEYCMSLFSITIPESLTEIGENAFAYCNNLTSITIPEGVTTIGDKAFSNCTKLETVTIGKSLTTIGEGTFAYCNNLSSIIIPNSVTTIGKNAFDSCTKLESVTIGNAVEKIDVGTFSNCTSLETIKIPDSVQIIGDYAFDSCESLKSVTIGEKTETIGGYAFRDCSLLGEIKIPDSVKTIGNYAFDNCISLGTAIIGNEVKTIGDSAFGNCVNLKSLTIGKAVETIGELAFQQCPLLTEIVIPASVTKIGENALIGCSGLKYIFFEGTEEAQKDVADSIGIATNVHYGSSTHTFEENYTVDVEPTCTEKGSESQHCKYCELTQNERDVKENGHTSVNGGKIDVHTKCDVCGVTLSSEHEFTKTVIKAPTCTSQGVETWTCECGYSETTNVEEIDHNFVNHDGKVATCTEDGYYPYQTCTTCDYTTYHVDPAKGHDIVIDKAVEATCTKTGLTEGSHCTRCDDETVKQEVIPTKAHTEVTVTGKAATCTETGLTDGKKCSVCGTTTVKQETIAKKAHTEVTVTGKAATCTEAGLTDGKRCSVCDEIISDQKVISALGHDYSKDFTIDKAATYTENGSKSKHCSRCDARTEVTVIKKKVLATPVVSFKPTAGGMRVTWNKINDAESYTVYKKIYNAKTKKWSVWSKIKTDLTATGYTDTAVKPGENYKYTVKAVKGKATSSFKTLNGKKYNVTPVVTAVNASNGIKVTWSTVANATGYAVYSSSYNAKTKKWSSWKNRGTAGKNKTAWVDKSAKKGTYYRYTVRAVYGSYKSSYKASENTIRLLNPTVKVAKATNAVKVSWNKIAGAKNYRVYRAEYVNGKWSGWKVVITTESNTFAYADKTVKKGVTYKYTVRAVNGKSMSSYKASSSIKK
ncbi:MAG: leucine-rich repeat protein [Clostridia bacterium]|nr:leucine-rich repeat protein [Clostridia bacterium]